MESNKPWSNGNTFDSYQGDRVATEYERTGRRAPTHKQAFLFAQIRALQTGKRQKLWYQPPYEIFGVLREGKWMVTVINARSTNHQ
jgi:hypothetical protein